MKNELNSLALAAEKELLKNDWITVIDENGFWLGQILATRSTRKALREDDWEIRGNYATKQYAEG